VIGVINKNCSVLFSFSGAKDNNHLTIHTIDNATSCATHTTRNKLIHASEKNVSCLYSIKTNKHKTKYIIKKNIIPNLPDLEDNHIKRSLKRIGLDFNIARASRKIKMY